MQGKAESLSSKKKWFHVTNKPRKFARSSHMKWTHSYSFPAIKGFFEFLNSHLKRWSKAPSTRELFKSKIFWAILIFKVVLGSFAASYYLRDLFLPFVNHFVDSGFSNSWDHFYGLGKKDQFPYPPLMLYIISSFRWMASPLLSQSTTDVTIVHLLLMRLPLLFFDFALLFMFVRWFPHRVGRILFLYWASPIVIYVNYWHGQLDIIPTALFVAALFFLRQKYYSASVLIFALALSTKSHLVVALPFFFYFLYQKNHRDMLKHLCLFVCTYLILLMPFLFNRSFLYMVFGSYEQIRVFEYKFPIGDSQLSLLLAPCFLLLLLFRFFEYRKINFDLFALYLGIIFSTFVLLVPPRAGYFMWSLPFVIYFFCRSKKTYTLPYMVHVVSFLLFYLLGPESDLFDAWRLSLPSLANWGAPQMYLQRIFGSSGTMTLNNLNYTILELSLVGVVINMYLFGVRSNEIYKQRESPIMIGIAGDSGAGKDTFVSSIEKALGQKNVAIMAGDDYHRWPRGHEMWQVYTHLDVRANSLQEHLAHAVALKDGKTILKGSYDHDTGTFTEKKHFDPDDFLVFNGLHSLATESMRQLFELKIFMDPDDTLRRFWKMKRDIAKRGYTPHKVIQALKAREKDRCRFILPQREFAELIIQWFPLEKLNLDNLKVEPNLGVRVYILNSFHVNTLLELLEEFGIQVLHNPFVDKIWQSIELEGEINEESLLEIAKRGILNFDELFHKPYILPNLQGCLQLIFLVCLSHKLTWKATK